MRVPTISTYQLATYQLGTITENLKDANEVMSTQKDINSLSDDPIGLTQVMGLNVSIENLEQIETNVQMGTTWLSGVETALDSVSDLILDMKTDVLQLANASTGIDQRKSAVERVDSIIEQIVSLGNTQVNGNYLFSGNKTDTLPLEYQKNASPPQVVYRGDETPFQIRSDKNEEVDVGMVASSTFRNDNVAINTTNNTIIFKENPDHGPDYERLITATVPDGDYDKNTLADIMAKSINEASSKDGYGLTYEVEYDALTDKYSIIEDGSYNGYMETEFFWETGMAAYGEVEEGGPFLSEIQSGGTIAIENIEARLVNADAVDIENDTETLRLNWDGKDTWVLDTVESSVTPAKVETLDDGSVELYFNDDETPAITIDFHNVLHDDDFVEFKINKSGAPALDDTSLGHEIGFIGKDMITAPIVSDNAASLVTITSIAPTANNTLEFSIDGGGTTLTATIPDGNYSGEALADALESEMNNEALGAGSPAVFAVTYDPELKRYNIREDGSTLDRIDLYWSNAGSTAAVALGYDNALPADNDIITYPISDNIPGGAPVVISQALNNNMLDFREITMDGKSQTMSIQIPDGTYGTLGALAAAVEAEMTRGSAYGVSYDVSYNSPSAPGRFMIKGSDANIKGFELLWNSGENGPGGTGSSIAATLGFNEALPGDNDLVTFSESDKYAVDLSITTDNNKIDFQEIIDDGQGGKKVIDLTASVKIKPDPTAVPPYTTSYTSHEELAKEVEKALESESLENGNRIDYSVSWDMTTEKFTIKENGTRLDSFNLLWQSGENAPVSEGGTGKTIGPIMGFEASDDTKSPLEGTREAEWGIFNTLLDLRGYLETNDVDGIERTIGRLDTSYENVTSTISETGMKYSRLKIRESLTTEMNLYLTNRRSSIEDADIVEATMKLTSVQSAYDAALKSTSKIINISLMDYI